MENFTERMVNESDAENNRTLLDYKNYDEAAAVISFVLFVAIVTLNGLVIYVLSIRQKKRTRLHFFVLHLAIADILVGFICVLGDGIRSAMYGAYYGGDTFCKIWLYSKMATTIASNNILIGMSIDRFMAVKYPLQSGRSGILRYLDKALVAGAWLISLLVGSIYLMHAHGVDTSLKWNQNGMCKLELPEHLWKPFVTIAAAMVYILPTVGITVCYVGICIILWKNVKQERQLFATSRGNVRNGKHRPGYFGSVPKAKVRSIKMTLVICIAFFVCWTPYFVLVLLDVYSEKLTYDVRLFVPLGSLYPLNSACNPLIFILFNLKIFKLYKDRNTEQYDAVCTQGTYHGGH